MSRKKHYHEGMQMRFVISQLSSRSLMFHLVAMRHNVNNVTFLSGLACHDVFRLDSLEWSENLLFLLQVCETLSCEDTTRARKATQNITALAIAICMRLRRVTQDIQAKLFKHVHTWVKVTQEPSVTTPLANYQVIQTPCLQSKWTRPS